LIKIKWRKLANFDCYKLNKKIASKFYPNPQMHNCILKKRIENDTYFYCLIKICAFALVCFSKRDYIDLTYILLEKKELRLTTIPPESYREAIGT